LAPHHCSWTFFNDTPYKDNKTPKDYALGFLDYKDKNAQIIASSVKIIDNDNNPPCYQAKQEYVKKVGDGKFKNTAIHKNEKAPQPLVYTITEDDGLMLEKTAVAAAATILSSSAPRAGRN
jgi:hypothetical protein